MSDRYGLLCVLRLCRCVENIMKNVHCDYYSVVIEVNVNHHFLHVWDNFGCSLNDQQRATPTIRSLFDQTGLQVIAVTRHNGPPDPR